MIKLTQSGAKGKGSDGLYPVFLLCDNKKRKGHVREEEGFTVIKKMTSQKLILLVVLIVLLWGSGLLLPFPAHAQSTWTDLDIGVSGVSLYPGETYIIKLMTLEGHPCFPFECEWQVDNPGVVEISPSGDWLMIRALRLGSAKITAVHRQFNLAHDTMYVFVEPSSSQLTREISLYPPDPQELEVGQSGSLEVNTRTIPGTHQLWLAEDSLVLEYDPTILHVDPQLKEDGFWQSFSFRALRPGTTTITARYYGAVSNPVRITVKGNTPSSAASPLPSPLPPPESAPSPLPEQPQPEHWGLSATAGNGYITLTWQPHNPPSGKVLKGYYVYRSTQPGSASGDRIRDFPLLEPSWTDYAVESGQTYYYTVRALYADGTLSPPSEEVSATATSSTPVVIQLTIGQTQAKVNGIARDLIVPPVIRQERTMVPLRFIGEAMGAVLDWDPVERKVTYTRGDRQVVLWIDNPKVIVNGATQYFDPPPFVDKGTTLVPVRLVAEALGFTVLWDEVTQTVTILSSSQVSVSPGSTPTKPEPSTPLSVPAKLEPPTGFQVTTTRVNKWGQYLVKVSWNPVSGAAAYRVYSSSYLEDWSPWKLEEHVKFLGNSFEIVIDTRHRFYVTAVNQAGEESSPSQIITVDLPIQSVPVQVPPAPTNLHLAADLIPTGEANVYRIILSWDPAGNADTYRIYGFASYWSGYSYLGETVETSYTYTVAINKDDYWQFYVTAVNSAGESPPSNVITVTTPKTSATGIDENDIEDVTTPSIINAIREGKIPPLSVQPRVSPSQRVEQRPEIVGSPYFKEVVSKALDLLYERDRENYYLVCCYLPKVEEAPGSFAVIVNGKAQVFFFHLPQGYPKEDAIYYTVGGLVHEAAHTWLAERGYESTGEAGEYFATAVNTRCLLNVGAPSRMIGDPDEIIRARWWEHPGQNQIGIQKPEPPTGLHIDSIIPDSESSNTYRVTLSWNTVNNIVSYKVYSRALWIPNSGPVISETSTNRYTTSFYVGEGSKSWELYVTAVNAAGESLPSNVITVTLP